jgi:predicted DNA-binding transcriptional regulator AlpA
MTQQKVTTGSAAPELLDMAETCRLLRLSRQSLWRHRVSGDLPFIELGGRILFDKADLAAFVERNRHRGRQEAAA